MGPETDHADAPSVSRSDPKAGAPRPDPEHLGDTGIAVSGPVGQRPRAVGLVVHGGRREAREAAAQAAKLLREADVTVLSCDRDNWQDPNAVCRPAEQFGSEVDVAVVFGGDGTFLRAAYLARDHHVPILGVDLGRLGFLSEVSADEAPAALHRIVAGDFAVEERMTLTVEIRDADGRAVSRGWAVNEAALERTVPQRLIVLEISVGGTPFTTVPCDALICATPTGSTAYAFSARGPILSPLVHAILLVPVAPHSLFDRTLVVDPRETLTVCPKDDDNACVVTLDGREFIDVPEGGSVLVSRGTEPVRMARLGDFNFYGRVRHKFRLQ